MNKRIFQVIAIEECSGNSTILDIKEGKQLNGYFAIDNEILFFKSNTRSYQIDGFYCHSHKISGFSSNGIPYVFNKNGVLISMQEILKPIPRIQDIKSSYYFIAQYPVEDKSPQQDNPIEKKGE